jgi:hypothetical protein
MYRRLFSFTVIGLGAVLLWAENVSTADGIPWRDNGFDKKILLRDTASEKTSPFSLEQSYTLSYSSFPWGNKTQGVYLTTLRYQFDFPLELSADLGIYHLFSQNPDNSRPPIQDDPPTPYTDILLPRIGLEYRPTPQTSISLQLFNIQDACRAYSPFGPWRYNYYDSWRYRRYPRHP